MEKLMVGRDESSGTRVDPDDWFSDADSRPVEEQRKLTGSGVAAGREPTWLEDVVEPDEPTTDSPFARRRLVALAVAVLVLVVAVVVAVVAFGGGSATTPTVTTTSTRPTTTTATTAPAATVPATPAPSTTPVILPALVLRPGATGAEVKTVQRALARVNHSPGPIDGDYGPKTEQAVSDFQRSAGIPVDGHYGPQTKKALQQALNSR
jgi:Putative peptidoglycan binding domain